jgi:alanine racemase
VLVLLGLEPGDMDEAVRLGVRPAVFRLDQARMLSEAACRLGLPARVHVKVDTGMGRLGISCRDLSTFAAKLKELPGIVLEGLLSHFAEADEHDKSYCDFQIGQFTQAIGSASRLGLSFPYCHISNSAGIIDLPQAHFHLVRPGIMLYGSAPSGEPPDALDLQPVMAFKSKILQLKDVPAGQSIGYGRTFVTQGETRIATIAAGYDDGYFRLLSNRGRVLVRGKRAPVVGRVSMNLITVDVTHIPEAREDDEVVLLGTQGVERISAEEIAGLCGTISYEVYCAIGKQQKFKYFLNSSTDLDGEI